MCKWTSIVPTTPEDYYIVVNHYGRFGPAFAETDLDRADYETTIVDVMDGQHSDPLRVVMFNPDTDQAADVSHAISQEILRASGLKGATCRRSWTTSLTATRGQSHGRAGWPLAGSVNGAAFFIPA